MMGYEYSLKSLVIIMILELSVVLTESLSAACGIPTLITVHAYAHGFHKKKKIKKNGILTAVLLL